MAFAVDILESERGWGQKIDETVYFDTIEGADRFVEDFNSHNKELYVPDWYMAALEPRFVRNIPDGKTPRDRFVDQGANI